MEKICMGKKTDWDIDKAYKILEQCNLCPRKCGVNRLQGQKGYCGVGGRLVVHSWGPHFGEEVCLVGIGGSGTIFFTGCNLKCIFCQNYQISHYLSGYEVDIDEFASIILSLQDRGCHNINLVTPSHFVPHIIEGISIAKSSGLRIPVVYNCGGYELVSTLKLLEGIIDIYMPDAKFSDAEVSKELASASDYFEILKSALLEMHRQVGDLLIDDNGLALRGLLVRHLVMPGSVAGTEVIMRFISEHISKDTYVNIMEQYHPEHLAVENRVIDRRITYDEYKEAIEIARSYGLHRGFCSE